MHAHLNLITKHKRGTGNMSATNNKTNITSKRKWIYAKKPAGELFKYRQWVGYTLLTFLFVAPFIKINGEPFLLFNIIDRKFVIFGNVFWPQDLHIFVFGMLIMMVCVVLFTVVYGRLWCGWAWAQTIFMELIFRRIEYWLEGDWIQQKNNDQSVHSTELKIRKAIKHSLFLLISFFISNIFLSYIIGVDALWEIITDPVNQHIGGLISIVLFTLVFYFVFAYVREIVCIAICPYGRLQGVLMDEQTITIAYDYQRGEPRGHKRKDLPEQSVGDCVDCGLCVHVCPTGIDIRKGTQLECVNCTACIDVCDGVMEKLNRPKKLIGYYSSEELEQKKEHKIEKSKKLNKRAIAYTIVLTILIGVFGMLIFNRVQLDGTLLRAKGSTYQLREDGTVSNLFSFELLNKSAETIHFELVPRDSTISIQHVNAVSSVKSGESIQMSLFLLRKQEGIKEYKTDVKIDIIGNGKVMETLSTTFIAPPENGQIWQ
jgi:cytochrome c oxidase accessory protein FixG